MAEGRIRGNLVMVINLPLRPLVLQERVAKRFQNKRRVLTQRRMCVHVRNYTVLNLRNTHAADSIRM